MANLLVKALVSEHAMEIVTDNNQWQSLTVNNETVNQNPDGTFSKTVELTQGVKVPFVLKAFDIPIVNGNFKEGINGITYDGYWLTIDYSYTNDSQQETTLTGSLEWKNGFIHGAQNEYKFSQGNLTGQFVRVE